MICFLPVLQPCSPKNPATNKLNNKRRLASFLRRRPSNIPAIASDLQKLADVKYSGRKAIICLVGESLREKPGIAGQVFGCIPDVNVRMISQGASEINISFVIDEDDVQRTVERLHAKFFAELDPESFD